MDTDRIKGVAQDIGGSIQKTVGDVAGDASTQAAGLARQAAGRAQDLYGQAKDSLRDAGGAVADYAGDAYEHRDHYARRGRELARSQIGENPLTAIVLAGTVGYLIGMLVHSRG